jgi:predicted O-methyltransferase YrrM
VAAQDVIAALAESRPPLHTSHLGPASMVWALDSAALAYLADVVQEGWTTVETGCGYSTLVLAAAGARHTAITPVTTDHDAVRAWAGEHDVDLDGVTFLALPSHLALAQRPSEPIDLLLIDGNHSIPVPEVDWFLVADDIRLGGLVVIDDCQLAGPVALASFLRTETSRWKFERLVGGAQVFSKLVAGPVTQLLHDQQSPQPQAAAGGLRRLVRGLRRRIGKRQPA